MKIKNWILSLLFSIGLTPMAAIAQQFDLDTLSKYLNSLTHVKTSFDQFGDDGSRATGTIFIKRPGRIRFEYDPPNDALVLASGGKLAIFDPKGDPKPTAYPLRKTPLSIILAKNIDLSTAKMVVDNRTDGDFFILTLQDPEHPERGKLDLFFTGDTPRLDRWIVYDENGGRTMMVLNEFEQPSQMGEAMFNISLEIKRREQ